MTNELRFGNGNSNGSPSVSYIPVMASPSPRKPSNPRGAGGGAFGLPQFSLLPSPRYPSTGNSSSSLSLASTPSQHRSTSPNSPSNANPIQSGVSTSSGLGTGIPKFRALRNMLPFGPKHPVPNSSMSSSHGLGRSSTMGKTKSLKHRRSVSSIPSPITPSPPSVKSKKQGYLTIGHYRSSLSATEEKTLPPVPSNVNRSRSEDLGYTPLSVKLSSTEKPNLNIDTEFGVGLRLPKDPFRKPSPNISVTNVTNNNPPSRSEVNHANVPLMGSGDLSTIIESELSNISTSQSFTPVDAPIECLPPVSRSSTSDVEQGNESETLVLANFNHLLSEQSSLPPSRTAKEADTLLPISRKDMGHTKTFSNLSESWETGLEDFRMHLNNRDEVTSSTSHSTLPGASPSSTPEKHSIALSSSPSRAISPSPLRSQTLGDALFIKNEGSSASPEEEQISFNLSALDPDLAAMLRPHTYEECQKESAIVAIINSVTPPPPMHSEPSSASESHSPDIVLPRADSHVSLEAIDDVWLATATSRRASIDSRRRTVGLQSSPVRRSRPTSLALSTDSLHNTDITLKRLSTDITSALSVVKTNNNTNSNFFRPLLSPTCNVGAAASHASLDETTESHSVLARSYSVLSRTGTMSGDTTRRTAGRVFATPSRPSTSTGYSRMTRVVSDSNRPVLRKDDLGSVLTSPGSHSATSLSLSASVRRPGTSLSAATAYSSSAIRNRKRSMSVADTHAQYSPTRPKTYDWMGPRTARAFAAAGLLDNDLREDGGTTSGVSRLTESRMRLPTPRTSAEHDFRLQASSSTSSTSRGAGAGAIYSDLGKSRGGSWGRKRGAESSRTMSVSDLISVRGGSPITATSTTAASTTPTTSNSMNATVAQVEMLKEKHSTEMEALLGALADSQRTTRGLREENTKLSAKIQELEKRLEELVDELEIARRAPTTTVPTNSSFARSLLQHKRSGSRASPSRLQTYRKSFLDDMPDILDVHTNVRDHNNDPLSGNARLSPSMAFSTRHHINQRERDLSSTRASKRASTASSVFPLMPSNMSMLLHDDGSDVEKELIRGQDYSHDNEDNDDADIRLGILSSPSPSLDLGNLIASTSAHLGRRHMRRGSFGSGSGSGHTSIDMSAMSMLSSLPDSPPSSLRLRPEHEKHLGDMMSLDLGVIPDFD